MGEFQTSSGSDLQDEPYDRRYREGAARDGRQDRLAASRYQGDRYDITMSERKLAIEAGAKEVTLRELALIRRAKREARSN